MKFRSLIVTGLLLGAAQAQAKGPSFATDIVPILKTRCAICHLTGNEAGNMALHPNGAYASLVSVKSIEVPTMMRVKPGDPDNSYLIAKIEGKHIDKGGKGARMPFGAAPLPQDQIDLFRAWVKAGAKKN